MVDYAPILEKAFRPLRRVEYDRLVELGMLEGERVELLYGRIVRMAPQGPDHSGSIDELTHLLVPKLVGRARVRVQLPFVAPDESEPEPDLAVVPVQDAFAGHPSRAYLIVEVAGSSHAADRGPKSALYASAAVPEYWIVDVAGRRVERYRQPLEGRYTESSLHVPGDTLTVPGFPDVEVEVARILPPG